MKWSLQYKLCFCVQDSFTKSIGKWLKTLNITHMLKIEKWIRKKLSDYFQRIERVIRLTFNILAWDMDRAFLQLYTCILINHLNDFIIYRLMLWKNNLYLIQSIMIMRMIKNHWKLNHSFVLVIDSLITGNHNSIELNRSSSTLEVYIELLNHLV